LRTRGTMFEAQGAGVMATERDGITGIMAGQR
jgi:hypothetical protein